MYGYRDKVPMYCLLGYNMLQILCKAVWWFLQRSNALSTLLNCLLKRKHMCTHKKLHLKVNNLFVHDRPSLKISPMPNKWIYKLHLFI